MFPSRRNWWHKERLSVLRDFSPPGGLKPPLKCLQWERSSVWRDFSPARGQVAAQLPAPGKVKRFTLTR